MSARQAVGKPMLTSLILKSHLLDSSRNFTLDPDPQTGHGAIDAVQFFQRILALP